MAQLGAWLQVIPVLDIVARGIGITQELAARHTSGVAYSSRFTAMDKYVYTCTTVAILVALIGLVLITIAITACRYRAKWLFEFLRFYGVIILGLSLVVEFGRFRLSQYLPFGLFFLIYAFVKKDEFLPATPEKPGHSDGDELET
ncbi:MAG: hypothetical protein B7Z55_00945 [Planctomycetales bacterium 12-60-4]|nr:MAG: hypothetical protein B7Z55_00945 [Planctomycetales bacterium 12-60-4]